MKNLTGFLTAALVLLIPLGVFPSIDAPVQGIDTLSSTNTNVLLPARGLYVQFERRGWASGYYSGELLYNYNEPGPVAGHTIADEVSDQLDAMAALGVNRLTFELRSADNSYDPFVYPQCTISRPLGPLYPDPADDEIANLASFFDLVDSKGMKIYLRLVNTHMEESAPFTNNTAWLGEILNAVKDKPALDLVLFEGTPQTIDLVGNDLINDSCGVPAEPPLWMGPTYQAAVYIQWAIAYAHSLGIPYRKLSAQAIAGDFYAFSQGDAGPQATDSHQWDPVAILDGIFNNLGIPANERTYAISLYEHPKCQNVHGLACTEIGPHAWALETVDNIHGVIGEHTGARVVAVEMGLSSPVSPEWTTEMALESLVWIFQNREIEGGSLWRWTDFGIWEEFDPELSLPVKYRSWSDRYTPVAELFGSLYTVGQSSESMNTPDSDPPVFDSVLASPTAVSNGDTLTLTVDLGETHNFVTVDPDPLDDGSNGLVVLIDQGDGTYARDIPLSLWNTQPNGLKTLTIQAMDFWSNVSATTVNVTLANPAPVRDWNPPEDDFNGPSIDLRKWMDTQVYGGGTITQNDHLVVSTGTGMISSATAYSNWVFPGDFDVEVEFEIGPGWGEPASGHLGGATFGVLIDGELYQETRIRRADGDNKFMTWSSAPMVDPEEAYAVDDSVEPATEVLAGRYRIIREGTRLYFIFDKGSGWIKLGEATVPADPATIYLGVGSNDVSQIFTTYFDNFKINSGLTTYRSPFFLPLIIRP
jgi:hypothetical protein